MLRITIQLCGDVQFGIVDAVQILENSRSRNRIATAGLIGC